MVIPIDRQDGYNGPVVEHVTSINPDFPGALGGDDFGRHFVIAGNLIHEFDPINIDTIINTFAEPATADFGGLAFDGTTLFASDSTNNILYSLDPNNGAVLNQVSIPAGVSGLGVALVPSSNAPEQSEANALVNGSFETGDFSGWTTAVTNTPLDDWTVSSAGAGSGFGFATTQPQDGTSNAWNGFDGSGPMDFTMFQDVVVPSAGELTFQYRAQWDFSLGGTANIGRDFFVEVLDPGTSVLLDTVFAFNTGDQSTNPTGDTGWLTETADLSAFSGQMSDCNSASLSGVGNRSRPNRIRCHFT